MTSFTASRAIVVRLLLGLVAAAGFVCTAHATIYPSDQLYTVVTPAPSSTPYEASALFHFDSSNNTLTVTLDNLLINQKDVGQNVSGLFFSLNGISSVSLNSQSNLQNVDVSASGVPTYSASDGTTPGWAFSSSPTGVNGLDGTSTYNPAETIIGAPDSSGLFSNANSSIAGNDPHNPFVSDEAVFVFKFTPIATATLSLNDVQINFGTSTNRVTAYKCIPGQPTPYGRPIPCPEPATIVVFGMGVLGLGGMARRRKMLRAAV